MSCERFSEGVERGTRWVRVLTAGLAVMAVSAAAILVAAPAQAAGPTIFSNKTIVQPGPIKRGPGSVKYKHRDWRVSQGGTGYDAWYTFEPVKPRPRRAPVAVVTHGYFEFSGYDRLFELIRHTVLRGSVVVFPRWQTGEVVPCPGPYYIEPCMDSAVKGIKDGLNHLRKGKNRVKPNLSKTSYFGYSFGGIITANIADQYREYGLPRPRAIFLDDPHDGELAGPGEPALNDTLTGIPANVKFECHSGANGVIGAPGLQDGSCNSVFPKLGHIPNRNKALVMTHTDSWGTPTLSSAHGVCAGEEGTADAYDQRFCWRDWDALRICAIRNKKCHRVLGTGRKHTWLGRWSDGRPVTPLTVQKEAPLVP